MTDHQQPISTEEPKAIQHSSGWWFDEYGILGPYKPGIGPRSDPRDKFPTGPTVGDPFPSIAATAHTGKLVDVHLDRGSGPAVVVFSRATLW